MPTIPLSQLFGSPACRVVLLAYSMLMPQRAFALPWPIFPNQADAGQIVQQCVELQADLVQRMAQAAFELEAAAARYEQLYPTVRGDTDSEIVVVNDAVYDNPAVDTSNPDRFVGDPNDPGTSELEGVIDELRSRQEQLSGLHSLYAIAVAACEEELVKRAPQQPQQQQAPLEGVVF